MSSGVAWATERDPDSLFHFLPHKQIRAESPDLFNTCIFWLLLGCVPLTVCYVSAEDSCLQGHTECGHYSPFLALLKYFPNLVMGDIILV